MRCPDCANEITTVVVDMASFVAEIPEDGEPIVIKADSLMVDTVECSECGFVLDIPTEISLDW